MMFRFLIALLVVSMLDSYGSNDAHAQRGRPSAQPDTIEQTAEQPVPGRGGRGRAAMRQPAGQSGPGAAGRGHGHGNPGPLFTALDQDRDGQLSLAELRSAAAVMKSLDKDGDGLLSLAECAPAGGGGHGHGHGGGAPDPQVEAAATVKTLMEFDRNGDGSLTKDELPERMQHVIARADSNDDEIATQEELTAMALKDVTASNPRAGGRGRGRFRQSPPIPQNPSQEPDDK